jgi:hypothetical protein
VTETDASATEAAPDPAVAAANAAADAFIGKWRGVPASELSTSQSFLLDLCALLGVDAPHATPEHDYLFERPVTFRHGDGSTSAGRIDLYRRGAFVLESKRLKAGAHTKGFDEALLRARGQAESYARALPAAEGRPPFLVVVDVGQRIELYSEFSRSGATYTPFPDPRSHRIALDDLRRSDIRERSAIGHGTVKGVHKKGTNAHNTMYSIAQHDHHPGEPAIVIHSGKALTRTR